MNLKYKFQKNEEEGIVTNKINPQGKKDDVVLTETNKSISCICFVEQTGKRTLLNYSYLIAVEFIPDPNSIILSFVSHTITMKGTNLHLIFEEFGFQAIKKIECSGERYSKIKEESEIAITHLIVEKLKN